MIDYTKKLNCKKYERFRAVDINECTESNRGRIINSPAIRRLQQKTQVFPLEINAAVRSRLTHSLEVQQIARHIARKIIQKLHDESKIEEYKLDGLEHAFVSTSEMASLMHDIGNPPFGHFGELAINDWMKENVKLLLKNSLGKEKYKELKNNKLTNKIIKDIINFEGNAQGIRIVHSLQTLNLTYSQTASILKYTRVAYKKRPKTKRFSYLKKKPGFYLSEKEFIKKLCKELEIDEGCRFPLTYIMEAADDIAYGIADLEDAVEKGIMSLKKLHETIGKEADRYDEKGNYIKSIAKKIYEDIKDDKYLGVNKFIVNFRTKIVNELVEYAAKIYIADHEDIFNGKYNKALLEDNDSKEDVALKVLKDVARKYVFSNPEVEVLELKGNKTIKGLMEFYGLILKLSKEDFEKILNNEKNEFYIESRLFHRMSKKYINTYIETMKSYSNTDIEYSLFEWYYRARLLLDFISGMTDEYALTEYQILSATK